LSFLRHKKIYQSDGLKRELNCSFHSLTDHRSDESSTGYSFMSCSPAELMSASPASNSFSLNPCCYKALSSQPQLSLFLAVSTEGSTPVAVNELSWPAYAGRGNQPGANRYIGAHGNRPPENLTGGLRFRTELPSTVVLAWRALSLEAEPFHPRPISLGVVPSVP
jgi:hypothetical protein